jgi:hypothetical protein
MSKEQLAAEVLEHFGKALLGLIQLSGSQPGLTQDLQPQAFSTDDAAAYIGMSRSRFYSVKDKPDSKGKPQIPETDIDGQVRYLRKHLDRYLRRCETGE